MTDKIDQKEAERLLTPGNLGLRVFIAIGRTIPDNEFELGSDEALIEDLKAMDPKDLQEALIVVRELEQAVAEVIVERGGSAPELVRS